MAPVGGLPAASVRARTHLTASTSAPAPAAAPRRAPARAARRAPPLPRRVTNTRREIWDADDELKAEEAIVDDMDNSPWIYENRVPVWDPERGPLATRINATVAEETASDEISLVETAYWFHTPPKEGWSFRNKMPTEPVREGDFPRPRHEDPDELAFRLPLSALREGEEFEGVVSDTWLHHGAQVDFVGEWDGLIPITQEQWRDVQEELLPGTRVRVRVHRLLDTELYRWPVQLELLDEGLAGRVVPPGEWGAPANVGMLFDRGHSLDEVCAILHRSYAPSTYLVEPDMAMAADRVQYEWGWRESDINGNGVSDVERALDEATVLDIGEAAAQISEGW